jgi:SAM-dependent methyltransferase
MDKYLKNNKEVWNEAVPIHARSAFYDVTGFKAGKSTMMMPWEFEEVGDVKGKSLLHLQCHFGMDTLTWGRRGAKVTGVDFSDVAIKTAQSLSKEIGIKAEFICSDIYELPKALKKKFDIVYTSGGVLCWLPDLEKWGKIIAHFLKRGGFFYIMEGHPFMNVFNNSKNMTRLEAEWPYFHHPEPTYWEPEGDYADPTNISSKGSYEWTHSLGEIINSLIQAGLKIEFLHEHTAIFFKQFPFMIKGEDGYWHLEGDKLPLTFSLKATKQ